MTTNLVDAVHSQVSPDVIDVIARDTGAPATEVSSVAKQAAPAIVAGLIYSASTEGGASKLLATATEAHESGLIGRLTSFGAGDVKDLASHGQRALGGIFGNRSSTVAGAIASSSGGRPEVASRVLAMLSPIALGLLGKEVVFRRLGPQGLMQFLAGQRRSVIDHPNLPRGLAAAMGIDNLSTLGTETVTVAETPETRLGARTEMRREAVPTHPPRTPWGMIGAVIAGLCVLALLAWCGSRRPREATMERPAATEPVARAPVPTARPPMNAPAEPETAAPNEAPPGGGAAEPPPPAEPPPAAKGTAMNQEPTSNATITSGEMAGPAEWGQYKLHFKFASTDLSDAEGHNIVQKLATTMRDHPDARVKLVGHTDSVGAADVNQKLALGRAVTIKKMLVDDGIDGTRIDVGSSGKTNPTANNGTAEGRAENRRVDVLKAGTTK